MARIALGLEYDGTRFVGWQTQQNGPSVQAALAAALETVAAGPVQVTAAGRTDAGVHAGGQVVHFDTSAVRRPRQWVLGLNSNLPDDVAVRWAQAVPDDFDARRAALWRRYRYVVCIRPTRPALTRHYAWWLREPLDGRAMLEAATAWLGEQDFSAFRAAGCQSKTPMRRMMSIGLRRRGELLGIEFRANAFLHHMVRNLVGVLIEIGRGRAAPAWAAETLAGRDRARAGVTAPACGLTLVEVAYPARFGLPAAGAEPAWEQPA